jgi:hypothetical protein
MCALSIQPTFPLFTETDGLPLENGYIWIGAANLDPQGNPISVYWDAALTISAAQPIRTLNGYPSRNGTPARLYVNSDYSIRVQNSKGSLVYSAPAATERYSEVVVITNAEQVVYDPPFTSAVQTNVEAKLAQTVSVKDFGAVGDGVTDDFAAIQDANDEATTLGKSLYFPGGVYGINTTAAGVGLSQTTSWFADNDVTILRLDFGSGGGLPTVYQLNQNGLMLSGFTFDGQVTTASTPLVPNNDPPIGTYVAAGDSASEAFWTDVRGVLLQGAQNAIVENCTFKNFLRSGLRVDNQFNATQGAINVKINKCGVYR